MISLYATSALSQTFLSVYANCNQLILNSIACECISNNLLCQFNNIEAT